MPTLYEMICIQQTAGEPSPREVSLGFIAASEYEAANAYCRRRNTLAMYNDAGPYAKHDYRLRPAVHPSLQFEDEVIVVEVYDDDRSTTSKTSKRADVVGEHGAGANAVVFEHSYREILPIIDGEDKAHWEARREGVVARGKAILKMQAERLAMETA